MDIHIILRYHPHSIKKVHFLNKGELQRHKAFDNHRYTSRCIIVVLLLKICIIVSIKDS